MTKNRLRWFCNIAGLWGMGVAISNSHGSTAHWWDDALLAIVMYIITYGFVYSIALAILFFKEKIFNVPLFSLEPPVEKPLLEADGRKFIMFLKKHYFLNWILWWRISADELKEQIDGYKTLPIQKTAKGISAILLAFSSLMTIIGIINGGPNIYLLDTALLLILAVFIFKGSKISCLIAMLYLTIDKLITIYGVMPGVQGDALIAFICFWAIYMHAFFLAFRVERSRALTEQQENKAQLPIN